MTAGRTFAVKNFDRFQHYKDRSPPWIKLYNDLLDDYGFGALPDASKFHLIAIWLLASRYNNEIPYDAAWVARRINAASKVDLDGLAESGFIYEIQGRSRTLAEGEQDACLETEESREESIGQLDSEFDLWWSHAPRKTARGQAKKAYVAARRKADQHVLLLGIQKHAAEVRGTDPKFIPHPATWLNGERWLDEGAAGTPRANGYIPMGVGG